MKAGWIGRVFEGTLDKNLANLTGTWKQNGAAFPCRSSSRV
jgi:hypothetical protein